MIGDADLNVAKLYSMLPAEEGGDSSARTAATNVTVRTVLVIGPDKKIKPMMTYPMITGRKFDEMLRALDFMQLTSRHNVATPVNWLDQPAICKGNRANAQQIIFRQYKHVPARQREK